MSSNGNTPNNRDNKDEGIKENEHVKRMLKDKKELPTDTTVLYGYVGSSDSSEITRLYTDFSFKKYYEINKNDIKDWKENTEDKDPFGGTYLFIDSDAEIKVVQIQVTKVIARFLAGAISERVRPMQRALRRGRGEEEDRRIYSLPDNSCDYTCLHTDCATCGRMCDDQDPTIWTCDRTCYGTCQTCDQDTCDWTCGGNTCDWGGNSCLHQCKGGYEEQYGRQNQPKEYRKDFSRQFKPRSRRHRRR